VHYRCINNPRKLCPICPSTKEDTNVDKDANVDEDVNMDEDEDEDEDEDGDEEVETQPENQDPLTVRIKSRLIHLWINPLAKNPINELREMTLLY
jgi:TATA-binding protein-associated factor Taf7